MQRFGQIDTTLFSGLDPAQRSEIERQMTPRHLRRRGSCAGPVRKVATSTSSARDSCTPLPRLR
jgi:hypothetical protein